MFQAIQSSTSALYGVLLLVPGYVWTQAEQKFIPRSRISWSERVFGYLAYTAINYAVWWFVWIEKMLPAQADRLEISGETMGKLVVILLISPAIGGSITGMLKRFDLLNKIRIPTIHRIDTAWDWMFLNSKTCLASVELKNGKVVYGWLGRGSMASTDSSCRDVFLESVFVESGELLNPDPDSLGVWIHHDEIKTIRLTKWEAPNAEKRRWWKFWSRSAKRASSGHPAGNIGAVRVSPKRLKRAPKRSNLKAWRLRIARLWRWHATNWRKHDAAGYSQAQVLMVR